MLTIFDPMAKLEGEIRRPSMRLTPPRDETGRGMPSTTQQVLFLMETTIDVEDDHESWA